MKIVYKPQRIPYPFNNSVVWSEPVIFCPEVPKTIYGKNKFVDYQRPYIPLMLWKDRKIRKPYNIEVLFGD